MLHSISSYIEKNGFLRCAVLFLFSSQKPRLLMFINTASLLDIKTSLIVKRGSYMSAHVFFDLLNELGKSDKTRG